MTTKRVTWSDMTNGISTLLDAAMITIESAPPGFVALHMLKGVRVLATEVSRDSAEELRQAIGICVARVTHDATRQVDSRDGTAS